MKKNAAKTIRSAAIPVFFFAFSLLILFPFLWLVLGSFKSVRELFAVPLRFWPEVWNYENYIEAWINQPFGQYIWNSLIVSGVSTLTVVFASSLASYSLARTPIKMKKLVLTLVLTVSLLPPVTLMNPIYQMFSKLRLTNTTIGLALVLAATELPTAIWLLTSFFQAVPFELEESAMLDGAIVLRIFVSVVIPLVAPGMFTVCIMAFIMSWNNYIFSAVLNQLPVARTVPVALTLFETESYTPWHLISAAVVFVSFPLVVIVMVMQKRIVSGLITGGVKG